MTNKFKVGDKVKSKEYGKGYIAKIIDSEQPYLVVHDKEHCDLHSAPSTGEIYPNNKCWWYREWEIELVGFTKDDLQTGDVVTLRNGDKLVYVRDRYFEDLTTDYINELTDICELTDKLEYDYLDERDKDYDIIKVERPTYTTVFERDESVKEMTLKEICDALGYEVKVIKEGE